MPKGRVIRFVPPADPPVRNPAGTTVTTRGSHGVSVTLTLDPQPIVDALLLDQIQRDVAQAVLIPPKPADAPEGD